MIRRSSLLRLDLHRKPSKELRKLQSNPLPPSHDLDVSRMTSEDYEEQKTESVTDVPSIVRRAHASSMTVIRMPYVGISGKYNRRWYVDAITLPHNSIRALLSTMYSMVNSSLKLSLDMSSSDFERIHAYISHFHRYLSAILEGEEKILYASFNYLLWRRVKDFNNKHPLHKINRKQTKADIIDDINILLRTYLSVEHIQLNTTTEQDRLQLTQQIRSSVDQFTSKILNYFSTKEKIMPELIFHSIRGARERNRLERLLIKFFAALGDGDDEFFFAAILATPLRVEQVREDFIKLHFGKLGRRREMFLKAAQDVEKGLLGLADLFEDTAKKYESKFSIEEFLSRYGEFEVNFSKDIDGVDLDDHDHEDKGEEDRNLNNQRGNSANVEARLASALVSS